MNKNVTIIPPSEDRPAILRVAAYCRVSTDSDDQATSYASQIRSYTELISQHEGWELVDIYADEAVSGTKTDKREEDDPERHWRLELRTASEKRRQLPHRPYPGGGYLRRLQENSHLAGVLR